MGVIRFWVVLVLEVAMVVMGLDSAIHLPIV
jgi:hypothetical protein